MNVVSDNLKEGEKSLSTSRPHSSTAHCFGDRLFSPSLRLSETTFMTLLTSFPVIIPFRSPPAMSSTFWAESATFLALFPFCFSIGGRTIFLSKLFITIPGHHPLQEPP